MNERIKELAKEAGEYVNSVYTPPVRSKTPGKIWEDGHIDWHTQFNRKFAELIVKECAELVRVQNEQFMENESHYGIVSTDVLKHFGVK